MVAEDRATTWSPITVAEWYGGEERIIEVTSDTAIWHSTGLPAVPLRWVLVRDPQGVFRTQAVLCTDLRGDPKQIVSWFVRRWRMEVTFQEVRRHLGFETGRQWSEMAIRRTAPLLLGMFSLITLFADAQRACLFSSVRRAALYEGPWDFLRVVRAHQYAKSRLIKAPRGVAREAF